MPRKKVNPGSSKPKLASKRAKTIESASSDVKSLEDWLVEQEVAAAALKDDLLSALKAYKTWFRSVQRANFAELNTDSSGVSLIQFLAKTEFIGGRWKDFTDELLEDVDGDLDHLWTYTEQYKANEYKRP